MINFWQLILIVGFFNLALNIFGELKRYFDLKHLDYPFDCKLKFFDGNRILGVSTTWGGLILIMILGAIVWFVFHDFTYFILSLTTFFGHATGSFIKRRLGFPRGKFLPIVDHGDYIILSGLILFFLNKIDWINWLMALILILCIQPIITFTFYKLGMRENKL